ncbi:alpha/beta hydrolase [Caldimonas brevitalea]|uniref:Alpha/beta hydrolase n=2 Tax=Caldimonas brevitalea TaxID=413882 RepID=A0A0G3BDD3_9BURK|nr:alpha/beta hydrolase [Caldimonas brevitalea]
MAASAAAVSISLCAGAAQAAPGDATSPGKPTVVLVHGAFAGSDSWNAVAAALGAKGYTVVAAANPLRSVSGDAAYVRALASSIAAPVVLVGHSYGGTVIANAATGLKNVKALVFVGAFAPDKGETVIELSGRYPGSTLGDALAPPVPLGGGGKDLYIDQAKFHAQFAADVPAPTARLMAATQRPVAEAALTEPSGDPAWKTIPSWFIFGTADKNIPPAAMKFMAVRAGARKIVEIPKASHVPNVSHPAEIAQLIEEAAAAKL